jgi:hypothetical protein
MRDSSVTANLEDIPSKINIFIFFVYYLNIYLI